MQRQWTIFLFLHITIYSSLASFKVKRISVNQNSNISLPCELPNSEIANILWRREGRNEQSVPHLKVLKDGSLFLYDVTKSDSGEYSCLLDSQNITNDSKFTVRLQVQTPPGKLINVTVHASTILALIFWKVNDTGGHPITSFTSQYRLADSSEQWKLISPRHISPNSRQIDVYKLIPNTTYSFRVWASNVLGNGEITEINSTTITIDNEKELVKHLLPKSGKINVPLLAIAVFIVMSTLVLLCIVVCYLLYIVYFYKRDVNQEHIELVPNIILNPVFEAYRSNEQSKTFRKSHTFHQQL